MSHTVCTLHKNSYRRLFFVIRLIVIPDTIQRIVMQVCPEHVERCGIVDNILYF